MNSRTYIRDKKRTVSDSGWQNGKIKKGHFPLFRADMPARPHWWWRAAVLESSSHEYRLLVQVRRDKPNFKAWLTAKIGDDWAMVARLESHGHAGLHVHLQCPELGIEVGQIDPPSMVSVPHWKAKHRRANEVLSDREAWHRALKFFRAQAAASGDLV